MMDVQKILHDIVNHLPINVSAKDELHNNISAEFGEKEETSAPE